MSATVRNSQLVAKIGNLRNLLGGTQQEFSDRLGVSRPQVSRWEKGTEEPSNEKLIALGNLADETLLYWQENPVPPGKIPLLSNLAEYPDSHWFWERAGIDLKAIRRSIRREVATQADHSSAISTTLLPSLDTAALMQLTKENAGLDAVEKVEAIPFPSLLVSEPSSTVCIRATDRVGGSLFIAGDLVLVRWLRSDPVNLLDCLVAVFYEHLPNLRELSPEASRFHLRNKRPIAPTITYELDQLRASVDWTLNELADKCLMEATAPGVLFGTLRVQSDERWNGDFNDLSGGRPWRLLLDCGATWNGLTDWSTERFPFDGTLAPHASLGVHVLGPVVGWLRAPGGKREE